MNEIKRGEEEERERKRKKEEERGRKRKIHEDIRRKEAESLSSNGPFPFLLSFFFLSPFFSFSMPPPSLFPSFLPTLHSESISFGGMEEYSVP